MADGGDAVPLPVVGQAELDCVQITPEHIRANGTIHTTPFAGIAELIDNAVDSGARNVRIENRDDPDPDDKTNAARYIAVIDDGAGMDREEALKTILVGYSMKRADSTTIGQFGNGLKSGSMRLGQTMLLATKKQGEFTVLMISLPYLDTVPNHKCYVPCISYKKMNNKKLVPTKTQAESETKHATALSLILQYSPFKTEDDLLNFLKTTLPIPDNSSGTCVAISQLKRLENTCYELKLRDGDLVVESREEGKENIKYQRLSEYLQLLYLEPRVVIKIQSRQVRVIDARRSLACPRWTLLEKKGMDLFAKREQEQVDTTIRMYEADRMELSVKLRMAEAAVMDGTIVPTKQMRDDHRRAKNLHEICENKIKEIKAQKATRGADIRVYLGVDVEKRGEPRMVFYSNGRRICTQPLLEAKGRKSNLKQVMGVVCTIDIPSTLLSTKQNREHFEIPSEFEVVVKKIIPIAKLYFAHIDKKFKTREFWESLGYEDEYPEFPCWYPDTTKEGANQQIIELMNPRRQCSRCFQFRVVKWDKTIAGSMEKPLFSCAEGCKDKTQRELADEEIQQLKITTKPTYYDDEEEAKKIVARKSEVKKPIARTPSVSSIPFATKRLANYSIPKLKTLSSSRSSSPRVNANHGNGNMGSAVSPQSNRRSRSPPPFARSSPAPPSQRSRSSSRSSSPLGRINHGNRNNSPVLMNNSVSPQPHRRNGSSSRSPSPSVPAKREKSNKFVRNAEVGLRYSANKKRKTTMRRGKNSKASSAEDNSDVSYGEAPQKKRPKKDSRPKRKTTKISDYKSPLTESEEEVEDRVVYRRPSRPTQSSDEEGRRDMSRGPMSGPTSSAGSGMNPIDGLAIPKEEPLKEKEKRRANAEESEDDPSEEYGCGTLEITDFAGVKIESGEIDTAASVGPKRKSADDRERRDKRIVETMKKNAAENKKIERIKTEPKDLSLPGRGSSSLANGSSSLNSMSDPVISRIYDDNYESPNRDNRGNLSDDTDIANPVRLMKREERAAGVRSMTDEKKIDLILKLQDQLKERREKVNEQSDTIKDLWKSHDEKTKNIGDLNKIIKDKSKIIKDNSKIISHVKADLHEFTRVDHEKMVEVAEKINQAANPIVALADEMRKIGGHREESPASSLDDSPQGSDQ